MENAGVHPTQVLISVVICLISTLTLYLLPKATLDMNIKAMFFFTNLLLLGCVVGVIFVL